MGTHVDPALGRGGVRCVVAGGGRRWRRVAFSLTRLPAALATSAQMFLLYICYVMAVLINLVGCIW